jgi:DNA repair protein RadC
LDAGDDTDAQKQAYHELLQRVSRSSGDALGIVAAWIDLFADGQYGVLAQGVCSEAPDCAHCPLQNRCRYLAVGGKDERASGRSLAQELLQPHANRSADLRTADVLAFVLSAEKSGAADIARAEALLKSAGGLRSLFEAKLEDLRELGIADEQLARLQALGELSRMWAAERKTHGRSFAGGKDFYDEYHLRLRDLKKEVFIVVSLDQKNHLLADEQISVGSLTETLVHPREVFANPISIRAAAVALIHNHPTGDPTPSAADKAITKRLESVSKLFGIRLLDHVIIGDGRFVSFAEQGWLS